jgi:hypothetical protein
VTRRHPLHIAAAALAVLVLHATPAAADPPRPTDYRSTVTAVEPHTGGVQADVVGGDGFLQMNVDGHDVVVKGYSGEPYLRFLKDGTVQRNSRSTATYLNRSRNARVKLPPQADNDAAPAWHKVGSGGRYAWHDHRIHWMGQGRPPGIKPGDTVQDWTVKLAVDGRPAAVTGKLVLQAGVNPLPWVALGLVAAGAVVLLARRREVLVAGIAVLIAAVGALVVGTGQFRVAPAGTGVNPLLVAVPAFAVGAAAVGLVLRRQFSGVVLTLAGAAAVIGWVLLRVTVLWKSILPTNLSYTLDRALTATALGLALAGAAVLVWGGSLAVARGRTGAVVI